VVLTATWLVPVALVPSAWDFEQHGRPRETMAKGKDKAVESETITKVPIDANTTV
jgi:hypothetical protein